MKGSKNKKGWGAKSVRSWCRSSMKSWTRYTDRRWTKCNHKRSKSSNSLWIAVQRKAITNQTRVRSRSSQRLMSLSCHELLKFCNLTMNSTTRRGMILSQSKQKARVWQVVLSKASMKLWLPHPKALKRNPIQRRQSLRSLTNSKVSSISKATCVNKRQQSRHRKNCLNSQILC